MSGIGSPRPVDHLPGWLQDTIKLDDYKGQPSLNYATDLDAAVSTEPVTLVNFLPIPMGCILFCGNGTAGVDEAAFSFSANGFQQGVSLVPFFQRGPFMLAPNTSVKVKAVIGALTVGAVIWPDLQWQMEREQVAAIKQLIEMVRAGR